MEKKIWNTIWVMGVLSFAVFCLCGCNRELDVEQSYDFTLEAMPVQKEIVKGETAEIRCALKKSGDFNDTRYIIRYFQPDGMGILKMDDGTLFRPNDRYPLTKQEFRLYYTSLSTDRQTIDIYVEDNFGRMRQLTFTFNNKREDDKKSVIDKPTDR